MIVTKNEVQEAFPIGQRVQLKIHPTHDWGKVCEHATYHVAFLGLRTFVVVETLAGRLLGEFAPKDLEVVKNGPS